jgi:RNA polymerase sigma-70 factor (ECF subfamily)
VASPRPDFAAAYDDHVFQVYGFFAYRVRSRTDAEDLTQQTFERALRAWNRFDPARASFSTWILSIARNLLIDHYRSDRSAGERAIDESDDWPAPDDPRSLGLAPELESALAQLGDREREIVALRFGGDLTGQQIANLTGLSLPNVQQILSRSLRRLKQELEDQAPSGPTPAALEAPASSSSAPEKQ